MTIAYVRDFVLPAAYALLPETMQSDAATSMLITIGWQESRFQHRVQLGGPARGFWQFERRGGVAEVLLNARTRRVVRDAMDKLSYPPDVTEFSVYDALAHNDVLAAVFARLLLWTVPHPLPTASERERGWAQYRSAWRPGRPHKSTWRAAWAEGWPEGPEGEVTDGS